jgi:hypothetical protein
MGRIAIKRAECRCCGQLHGPGDWALGLKAQQRTSPFLTGLSEEFGTDARSFFSAERMLRRAVPAAVRASTINACVDRAGAALRAETTAAIIEAGRDSRSIDLLPAAAEAEDTLIIQVDGGMVPTIDGYREVKNSAI